MANIILDYDGTIHDSRHIYVPAFRKGYKYLIDNGFAPERACTDEEITSYLGFSAEETWLRFMPGLIESHRQDATKIVGNEMYNLVKAGKSVLYDGAEEALQKLKAMGHTLIFLSNCMHEYMDMHRAAHDLDCFFSGYYCAEDYDFVPKTYIFKSIHKKFDGDFIIVGDRFLDLEIARVYGYPAVGCLYGYGRKNELDEANVKIKSVTELSDAIDEILKKIALAAG